MAEKIPDFVVQPLTATIKTYQFAVCPRCGQSEHRLYPNNYSNRGVDDHSCNVCNLQWESYVEGEEIKFRTRHSGSAWVAGYALLRYGCGGVPHYLIIEQKQHIYPNDDGEDVHGHLRYYLEEHTCPTNFLDVEKLIINGNGDPHGAYDLVRFVTNDEIMQKYNLTWQQLTDWNFGNGDYGGPDWKDIFPEAYEEGGPAAPKYYNPRERD